MMCVCESVCVCACVCACVCVCVSVCMCVMRQCCAGQCRAAVSIATDMGVRYGTKRVTFTVCVTLLCCDSIVLQECRAAVSTATDRGVRYGTKRVAFTVCVLRHCCAASDVVRNIDRYRYGGEKWHQACGLDIFLS